MSTWGPGRTRGQLARYDAADPECQDWQRLEEDGEEGRRELGVQDQQSSQIHSHSSLCPSSLTSLKAHPSPLTQPWGASKSLLNP